MTIYEPIRNPSIIQWVCLCILVPIQEEIFFRYAGYHLLEYFIKNEVIAQIINGVLFGLIHVGNGIVFKMNTMDWVVLIIANGHLGYCLATIHNNIFLCMIIHGVYNWVGIRMMLYVKDKVNKSITGESYIYTEQRRRSISVGFKNNYEKFHVVNKEKLNKELLASFDNYDEKKNCRYKDIWN